MIFNRECRVPFVLAVRPRAVAGLLPGLVRARDRFTACSPPQGSAITSASCFTGAFLSRRIRTSTGFGWLSRSLSAEPPQLPAVGVVPPHWRRRRPLCSEPCHGRLVFSAHHPSFDLGVVADHSTPGPAKTTRFPESDRASWLEAEANPVALL